MLTALTLDTYYGSALGFLDWYFGAGATGAAGAGAICAITSYVIRVYFDSCWYNLTLIIRLRYKISHLRWYTSMCANVSLRCVLCVSGCIR